MSKSIQQVYSSGAQPDLCWRSSKLNKVTSLSGETGLLHPSELGQHPALIDILPPFSGSPPRLSISP